MPNTFQPTILRFDSIDSTNLEAMRQAREGAPEGFCIIAREQTRGRGRLDRTWQSPKDAGLYFSLILRPRLAKNVWSLITLMAALAVSDSLMKTCALPTDIKWPNDVCVRDRKICGILAETVETDSAAAAIVGIGINLTAEEITAMPESAISVEAAQAVARAKPHETARIAHQIVDEAAAQPVGRGINLDWQVL